MNNNTIQINSYLQNEMSAEESAAFEVLLANDKELQYELSIQRNIVNAVVNAGLKAEFAKAIKQQIIFRQFIKWGIVIIIGVVALCLFVFRHNIFSNSLLVGKTNQEINIASDKPFINPPSASLDVPFSKYSFDAAKGYTIYYPSGSIISFPANAFVDKLGNLIKGIVDINYREFADPIDFFVSGITMDYDSAGVKYNFESSGMCEINASQNNNAVFVNQQAKPQINLSGKNKSPLHNVYFLDTVARAWKFIGKDQITEVKKLAQANSPVSADLDPGAFMPPPGGDKPDDMGNNDDYVTTKPIIESNIASPVKPIKATPGRQAFSIEIEPGSFQELFTYDKQKFEVIDESTYKRSDADEHWENVKLEKTTTQGIYTVIFSNPKRVVSYKVRPVLSGADYDAALKFFNEKNKAYEQAAKNRITAEKAFADSIQLINKQLEETWKAKNERNNKINEQIIARNKQLRELYGLQKEQQRALLENLDKYDRDLRLSSEIIRTFEINNFGVWNCDHPQFPDRQIDLEAIYTDNNNNKILLPLISIVNKDVNGITQFSRPSQIRVIPGAENMMLSISNGLLYYFTYNDFIASGINKTSKSFTFKMRKSPKEISSYAELRQFIEQL